MYRSTRRHWGCALSMGNATQARSCNRKGRKAQGQAQPSRWEAGIWHELLWNLHTCGYMVCHLATNCIWHLIQLGPLPSGLCYGLSTSPHQDEHVHGTTTDILTKHGNSKDHVLKLLANISRQKQAGRVYNNYLLTKIQEINSGMTSFSLPMPTMESSWDCQMNSYVASSTSYRT